MACSGTSLETLDPAIARAPTPRQLTGQDSKAQGGDENPPGAGLQEKQGPESEPRALILFPPPTPPHKQNPVPRGKREPHPTWARASLDRPAS